MERTLRLALNEFPIIPNSLRAIRAIDVAAPDVTVNLANLYHHFYFDSYGMRPDPDPAHFEYLRFILPIDEFRLRGDGIGANTESRRSHSNALGRAFCRTFLHDHLGVAYFAHLNQVINHKMRTDFSGLRIQRVEKGDTPDYFCAKSINKVFLAEAKGRYPSISFNNREFDDWRKQFSRIIVKDSSQKALSIKGFIVATRFATEAKPSIKSGIFAEDPESPGDSALDEARSQGLGALIQRFHYSGIAQKLNQPILSSALFYGYQLPKEIQFPVVIWELMFGPLQGKRFVGGYYPSSEYSLPLQYKNGQVISKYDPLRLDCGRGTFLGLEERIFRQVVAIVRGGKNDFGVEQFEQIEPFYSGISILRDGSVISPVEFFLPVEEAVI